MKEIFIHRGADFTFHGNTSERKYRPKWNSYEPRLLSEVFLALAYVLLFLRILSLVRADRVLGPLQVTLSRMLINILQFFCIFGLTMFAFGLSLSELYWFYGTDDGKKLCLTAPEVQPGTSKSSNVTCKTKVTPLFSNLSTSLGSLFWAIFGHIDMNQMSLPGKHQPTEVMGRILLASYHVVAIVVLINMLIAMMTKSYEITSSNEENEWKFHRTAMWIRFIRREVVRPPPMNLVPNPHRFVENFGRLRNFLKRSPCCRKTDDIEDTMHFSGAQTECDGEEKVLHRRAVRMNHICRGVISGDLRKQQSKKIMQKLVQRYKYRILLNTGKIIKSDHSALPNSDSHP